MITDRKEALLYLSQQQRGKVSDLVQNVAPDLVESFRMFCFISLDGSMWYLTSVGEAQCNFYRGSTSGNAK